jgi:hypothetical protein
MSLNLVPPFSHSFFPLLLRALFGATLFTCCGYRRKGVMVTAMRGGDVVRGAGLVAVPMSSATASMASPLIQALLLYTLNSCLLCHLLCFYSPYRNRGSTQVID